MKILNFAVFSGLALVFGILQSTALSFLSNSGILPDLAFLVVIYFTFLSGSLEGELLGFLLGLEFDILSSTPFGFYTFVFTLFGYLLGKFKGVIQLDIVLIPLLITTVSMIARWILMLFFTLFLGLESASAQLLQLPQLFQGLISIVISPVIFFVLGLIWRTIHKTKGFSV